MKHARMKSRWVMIVLIGSLAVAIALAAAGPRPQLVTKLSTGIGGWLAIQLAHPRSGRQRSTARLESIGSRFQVLIVRLYSRSRWACTACATIEA
jgi:hypothetical protein